MKPHTWISVEVDGGVLGLNDFWSCSRCTAGGRPVWPHQTAADAPSMPPYIADGSGTRVSEDCDEAAAQIAAHAETRKTGSAYDYALLRQRLELLAQALANRLPETTRQSIAKFLDVAEYGLAFEVLCEALRERKMPLPPAVSMLLENTAKQMGPEMCAVLEGLIDAGK